MSQRYITFRYLQSRSSLHLSDPVSKFAWFVVAMIIVVITADPLMLLAQVVLLLVLVRWFGHIKLTHLKPLLIILAFVAVMTFWGFFTAPADSGGIAEIRTFGGIRLSVAGAMDGFVAGGRFFLPAIIGLAIAYTTRQEDMTRALSKFVPYRLAYTASVGVAFIPVIQDTYDNIRKALIVRGLGFHGSLRMKLQAYTRLVFVLLVAMLRQADTMSLSLANRAFGVKSHRTYYHDYSFPSRAGWHLTLFWSLLAVVVVGMRVRGIEPTSWLLSAF